MVIEIDGNIFDYYHQAYAHGVSNTGKMGKGIAIDFKSIYPDMYQEYRNLCHKRLLQPGGIFTYDNVGTPIIFNLITQDNLFYAKKDFLNRCMDRMYYEAHQRNITDIAMPLIGCGLGGLTENDLFESLSNFIADRKMQVSLYRQRNG